MKLALVLGFLLSHPALAIDPFSVAMVVKSASDIANTASDVGGVADAFTELYTEVESDAQISEEGQRMIDEINDIDDLAREAGYTAQDINEIGAPSVDEARRLENSIRSITKAVKASKRTMRLFQRIDRKAQNAQIESTQIEKEQLAQLYKISREQQSANLSKIKSDLKDQIDRRNMIKELRRSIKEKGAKWFNASGALAFPKNEQIIDSAITVSEKLRLPMIALMLVIFLARLIYYQIGFYGSNAHGDLLRDALVCGFLLVVYPDLIRAILTLSYTLAESITGTSLKEIDTGKVILPKIEGVSLSMVAFITYIHEWIKAGAFLIVNFFMNFGMSFLVMIFPIVIFFSQMMNFTIGWPIFLGSFAVLSLWPVFWNLIGISAEIVWTNKEAGFSEGIYTLLLTLLQFVSPLIGLKLLSGSGVKDSISGAVTPVVSSVSQVVNTTMNAKEGYQAARSNQDNGNDENKESLISRRNFSMGRVIGVTAGSAVNRIQKIKDVHPSRNMVGEN